MVTLVVGRELIVTSLRGYLETSAPILGPTGWASSRWACNAAVIAIFVVLQNLAWLTEWSLYCVWLRDGLIWAMLGATLLSGLQYLWRAALLWRANAVR